jgi:hypothetical protein
MDIAEIRELFNYDPESGELTWRVIGPRSQHIAIGDPVGGVLKGGRRHMMRRGRGYYIHRLIWAYHYGKWPDGEIDHIDQDNTNNRLANLRDVPMRMNRENLRRAKANNRLGVLGVTEVKPGRFVAKIKKDGRGKYLGTFETPHEAHAAYVAAKRMWHEGNTL